MFTPNNKKFAALSTLRRFNDFFPTNQKDSVTFTIKRYYTNSAGTIVAKGSVPAALQVEFPIYLFGTFDRDGGYRIGKEVVPAINSNLVFADSFNYFSLFSFTGVNNIKDQLKAGDFVLIYADDLNFPTYFVWIVISGGITSYASLLNNPIEGGLLTKNIKYQADNEVQFNQKISMVNMDTLGYYKVDYIDPQMFKGVMYEQDGFINLNIHYNINNYSGLYFYMDYECDKIDIYIRYQNMINKNRGKIYNNN